MTRYYLCFVWVIISPNINNDFLNLQSKKINMKLKLILLSSVLIFFIGCKESSQPSEDPATENTHIHDEHDEHNQDKTKNQVLTLNNGEKWKADEPTQRHATQLIEINKEFEPKAENANLEMFRNYSDMLQQELNAMIRDCKMQGPEHDALHLWLEPVLQLVKTMKEAKNEEEARMVELRLTEAIQVYNQFFN